MSSNTGKYEEVVENGYKVVYKVQHVAGARRRVKRVARYPMYV